jgi:predicted negative regulator of RcsB-dependent stress response
MAHYDLEEQEQIDTLKTWWKMYGNLVTGLVMAASLAVVGWQGWNWYQGGQSAKAAAIYGVLEQAAAADAQKVKAAAGELAEKFGRTAYASLGAMVAAKQSFDAGDLKTAKTQLIWVARMARMKRVIWRVCAWPPCNSMSRPTTRRSSNWKPSTAGFRCPIPGVER